MTLVWITVVRGVMAIVLGLALALHHDRAPAALANFMGIYWILNGIVTFQWGLAVQGPRRRTPLVAGAIGAVTGAVVLLADVGTTFLLAILGAVIALTGLVHLLAGFERADLSAADGVPACHWDPGSRVGGDADPDVKPGQFALDVARERLGAPRRRRARLGRASDSAPTDRVEPSSRGRWLR
jgi:hypothetical protein